MEIKQRKKCGGCRCFKINSIASCELDYDVRNGKELYGVIVDGIPQEPCPKPTSVSDYVEALKNYRK